MHKHFTRRSLAACCLLAIAGSASAELRFNGFASIRATTVDSDTGVPPFLRFKGDGDVSFKDESLFGLQASADLGEGLTATVQMVAEGRNDFDVEARWAYLSYAIDDTHTLSAGRLANPIFNQSQYEIVGYAHNFARLPKSVYDDFEFAVIEGMSLDSTFFVGDYILETKLTYGSWDGNILTETFGPTDAGLENILSVNARLVGDWWRVFVGGFTAESDFAALDQRFLTLFDPAIQGALATGATQADVDGFTNYITQDENDAVYWFAGFGIDYNNILFDFEYASYEVEDGADATNDVWFAALGYRFGQSIITVHAEDYQQDANFAPGAQITNPILRATADGVANAGAARQFDGYGVTWRYDFHPSAALKVDYFSGEDERSTVGDYDIWSVGVDMVF